MCQFCCTHRFRPMMGVWRWGKLPSPPRRVCTTGKTATIQWPRRLEPVRPEYHGTPNFSYNTIKTKQKTCDSFAGTFLQPFHGHCAINKMEASLSGANRPT